MTRWRALFALVALVACSDSAPASSQTRPVTRAERRAQQPQTPPAAATFAYRLPAAERLVAIGDLHGDFAATQQVFELAGATDAQGHWIGGKLVVVQTGDQLDRGDGEREILDFLDRVQREAATAGGALHVLNGNHEIMNVAGDFRYVTEGALHAFDDVSPRARDIERVPPSHQGRAGAFFPGGAIAVRFAARPMILQVGDTVFAHAGVRAPHIAYGIDRLNDETRDWMLGTRATAPALAEDPEGPVWTRLYGAPDLDVNACNALGEALTRLGAARMVVGHTVMEHGVRAACDGRVHRIDVGLSRAYGSNPIQALELTAAGPRVLTAPRRATTAEAAQ